MTVDGWARASDTTDTLATAADRLRLVRRAHERFLALHAIDHLLTVAADAAVTTDNHGPAAGAAGRLFRLDGLDD